MTRTTVFLITLTCVLPSDGLAQTLPSPGERVRINQMDGTVFTGTLTSSSPETIHLSLDPGRVESTVAIPRSQIATLERQQGTRGRGLTGRIIGFVAGGAIAVATLKESHDDCELGGAGVVGCVGEDAGQLLGDIGRVTLGLVAGAVVGELVGSAFRTENWEIVPLIKVAPTGRGASASAFGFGLQFRISSPPASRDRPKDQEEQ